MGLQAPPAVEKLMLSISVQTYLAPLTPGIKGVLQTGFHPTGFFPHKALLLSCIPQNTCPDSHSQQTGNSYN